MRSERAFVNVLFEISSAGLRASAAIEAETRSPKAESDLRALHGGQKFGVGLGFLQALKDDFHLLDG
jgi:hypothetical protein